MFMKSKAQISLEFIVILGFILVIALFFANNIFGTTDINKSITRVKLRTLEVFSTTDSRAQLNKIDYYVSDTNLQLNLYINRFDENFSLSEEYYSSTIDNLEKSTIFKNVRVSFTYIN